MNINETVADLFEQANKQLLKEKVKSAASSLREDPNIPLLDLITEDELKEVLILLDRSLMLIDLSKTLNLSLG